MRVRQFCAFILIVGAFLLGFTGSKVKPTTNRFQPFLMATPDSGGSLRSVCARDSHSLTTDRKQHRGPDHSKIHTAGVETEFDDADSRKWIGENWDSTDRIALDWVEFDDRKTLRAVITSRGKNWAFMRTDAFPNENWETRTGLRADIYLKGEDIGMDVKLEVRGPQFDSPDLIQSIYCNDLKPDAWNTCTWDFSADRDYTKVAYLSIVFDHMKGTSPTFYVDNLRLVGGAGEEEWDDMDDGSRWWFYFGNWYNWKLADMPFGLEPISHNGGSSGTPAGSVYLQWDYLRGVAPGLSTAEVGTNRPGNRRDWSSYNRISADIRVSDPDVPINLFFWDPGTETGFGTSARVVGLADTWQTITWDIPWPSWFNNRCISEIKFVVNEINTHMTGTLYIDNIRLISDPLPSPVSGLEYVFEDFNGRDLQFNDFGGNWGELGSSAIATTFVTDTYVGDWGASLRIDYNVPTGTCAGVWHSLWGHSDYTQTQYLDFTDIYGTLRSPAKGLDQIHFWVRGSGMTNGTHNVRVEVKDNTGDFDHTAYRYITINDGNTMWRKVVLDAHVANAGFWSYNLHPPNPTKMKQLVFIVESFFNDTGGTFYIDDIRFVDADDSPFDLEQHTDDEFLDLISERAFLYFLDWYDPDTGLFPHRSTSSDLKGSAATGLGLTALAIGESRGWVDREVAVEMIIRTLRTLRDGQGITSTITNTATGSNGYRGFYYRFLGREGLREVTLQKYRVFLPLAFRGTHGDVRTRYTRQEESRLSTAEMPREIVEGSELSLTDTAILIAGILTVKEYFSDVQEISALADELYQRVEWGWMLDTDSNWFYKAWKPECGGGFNELAPGGGCFSDAKWHYYSDEAILINLLAIGSPTYPVSEEVFYAWVREQGTYVDHSLIQTEDGSLLSYSLAHLWVDFSILGADNHPTPTLRADWWDNSVEAAWAHWHFAADHQDDDECDGDNDYITYGERSWGLTGVEGPGGEYRSYGAPPSAAALRHDGTVPAYGAGMATMFLPDKAVPALKHYFVNTDLWRYRLGFGDAYNLDPPDCSGPWYNHATSGIGQGSLLIAIENYRSGLTWATIGRNDDISKALGMLVPRLIVRKQAEPSIVQPGSQVTYTIQLTNASTFTLTASITDTLPLYIAPGETSAGTSIVPGGVLVWKPTILGSGEVWTQTVAVTVEVGYAGLLANVVRVVTDEGARGTAIAIADSRFRVHIPLALRDQ
jgi:uncharacterized repeat protein (TIGR01451 family)